MIVALSVLLTAHGWLVTIRDPHPQDYTVQMVVECYTGGPPFRAVNQRDLDRPGLQRLVEMRRVPTPKGRVCQVWFELLRRLDLFALPYVWDTYGTVQRS